MTREQAAEILGVSAHSSPADRETRHDELRRQLEDKLAEAPTPGLREKYRASLKELEDAHAILAQSDDAASLRSEPAAERELSELESQERYLASDQKGARTPELRRLSAQVRAQDRYVDWLRSTLPSHPARVAKAEELLSARASDDASGAIDDYAAALTQLKADITAARSTTIITGSEQRPYSDSSNADSKSGLRIHRLNLAETFADRWEEQPAIPHCVASPIRWSASTPSASICCGALNWNS